MAQQSKAPAKKEEAAPSAARTGAMNGSHEDIIEIIRAGLSGPTTRDQDTRGAHERDTAATADRILSALEATLEPEQRKLSLATKRIRDLEKHVSEQDAYIDALEAQLAERRRVKPLKWNECRALGGGRKLVATDCFGREYARLDLKGQPDDVISDFKARAQEEYTAAILSALEATPGADGGGRKGSLLRGVGAGKFEEVQPDNPEQASYLDGMDSLCQKQFDFLRLALLALDNIPRSEQTALQAVAVQVLTKHLSGDPNAEQGFTIPT